jgi:hypothetical protein
LCKSALATIALPDRKGFFTHSKILCTQYFRNIIAVANGTLMIYNNLTHATRKESKVSVKKIIKLADGFLDQSSFFNLTF